jgi:hypothetical protein
MAGKPRSNVRTDLHGIFCVSVVATLACSGARPANAGDLQSICSGAELSAIVTGSSQIPSPCMVPTGSVVIETLYYQNASRVGGTALAAYPMLQLSAGVARRIGVVFDPPTQIAESGLRGAGIYSRSHSSYGIRYRLFQTPRIALGVGFAVAPPASLYAPSETQPKYLLDINSGYQLTPGLTIKGMLQESTSHTPGVARILPAQALGADFALSRSTVVSPDIGLRSVTALARPQSFGDLCVKRSLDRKLMFDMGLGTAFNPVAHAKAHYLSAGLSFKP